MTARLLLVEDNEMNRDMLTRRLARKGYEVAVAIDGYEGLEMALATKPDLILMDMTLPGLDGTEVTKRLKANPEAAYIPIIALTAHAMPADQAAAFGVGFDDYDTKPVDMPRLLEKIEAGLAKGRSALAGRAAAMRSEEAK